MKEGDKVKVKDEAIDKYLVLWARRVIGRVGVIRPAGAFARTNCHRVQFPAVGRKKEFDGGWIHKKDLELVE